MNPASLPLAVQATLPLALVVIGAIAGMIWPASALPPIDRWLNHRAAPWLAAAITALALRSVWGGLDAVPTIHDEAAYLLQASMLAHGHLVGPARPLPEFFEQFHVFVTPVLAARYPPGFALALVPGIWLGLPGLMPVILTGLTGGLLFALVRRIATPSIALLAWALWVVTPGNLRFRPTYLTESLSGLLWLAAWCSLLEWRETGKRGWLLALSAALSWQAITRPLTAIAFAIPIGIVVLLAVWRTRLWRELVPAFALGLILTSVVPWQNHQVTGNWRLTPLKQYSVVYFPFDLPGFGYDSTPPLRPWPTDFKQFSEHFGPMHREFTPDRLPGILVRRSGNILHDAWGRWWPSFAVLGVMGLAVGGSSVLFAMATCLTLVLLYLTFAHADNWTVYYIETEAVTIAIVAIGAGWLVRWAAARRKEPAPLVANRAAVGLALLSIVVFMTWSRSLREARGTTRFISFDQDRFRHQVTRLAGPAIVFIRYASDHDVNKSLIANEYDLGRAYVWLVYDRGMDNRRLMALAPGRIPYRYDEERHRFTRLAEDGISTLRAATADSAAAR